MTLAPGTRENSFVERFYLYLHLTKPSERLYLTMAKADLEGKAMRPSYVVGRIQRLFPELSVTDEEADQSFKKRVWTPENGLSCLTEGILKMKEGEFSPEFQELYLWYSKEPKWKEKLERLLHAAFAGNEDSGIGREAAKALYGNVLTNSVSRLETFAACACEHFLRYGLRLTERETAGICPGGYGKSLPQGAGDLFRKGGSEPSGPGLTCPTRRRKSSQRRLSLRQRPLSITPALRRTAGAPMR